MKKIFLAIVIFSTVNNFCFSQEEEKKIIVLSSRVTGSIGLQTSSKNFGADNGINVNVLLKHLLPFWDNNLFYYVDYGFSNIPKIEHTFYIPIVFGIGTWLSLPFWANYIDNKDIKRLHYYLGLEAGMDFEFNYYDFKFTKGYPMFAPIIGCSMHITDRTSLEAKAKFKFGHKDIFYGINVGIAYLLP